MADISLVSVPFLSIVIQNNYIGAGNFVLAENQFWNYPFVLPTSWARNSKNNRIPNFKDFLDSAFFGLGNILFKLFPGNTLLPNVSWGGVVWKVWEFWNFPIATKEPTKGKTTAWYWIRRVVLPVEHFLQLDRVQTSQLVTPNRTERCGCNQCIGQYYCSKRAWGNFRAWSKREP